MSGRLDRHVPGGLLTREQHKKRAGVNSRSLFLFARNGVLGLSLATEATWRRAALTHLSGLLEPFQIADKLIWPRCINSNAYHLPSLRSQTVGLTEKRISG